MKLTFLSNYYNHHQKSVCCEWDKLTNHNFTFVATEEFSAERKSMGWSLDADTQFVVSQGDTSSDRINSLVNDSDVVILGSAPLSIVNKRLCDNKLVFKYSERVFKSGYNFLKWPARLLSYYKNYGRYKSFYLMSASAYTAVDFAMHGTFRNKAYKWGYFPETKHYDIKELMSEKQSNRILWCGRFIDWKHPEVAIEVARKLRNDGYNFYLDIIGNGEMQDALAKMIEDNNLSDCVNILGAMTPEEVRNHMEKAGIYLFTSDFNEGWGAVLNESMNSGCAVVASHAIGSVPFLLKNGENGLIYKNGDIESLYIKVKNLLDNPSAQKRLGINAYKSVTELWNAKIAAERFIKFYDEINIKGYCDLYEDGPCSRAKVIKNNWFKEDKYDVSWIKN